MLGPMAHEFMQCLGSDLDAKDTYGLASCPLAPWRHENAVDTHPSFRVSLGAKKSWGHCYACNWRGPLGDLLMELQFRKAKNVDYLGAYALLDKEWEGVAIHASLEDASGPRFHPFPEVLLTTYPLAESSPKALWYLQSGEPGARTAPMPLETIRAFDLRWDGTRERVCFPVRDQDGTFCGLHGRSVTGEEPKYLVYMHQNKSNPHVLVGEHWLDTDKPIVVAESVFDAARCYQAYRNVVTPKTASVKGLSLEKLAGWFHLILVFDPDKAGSRAVSEIMAARKKDRVTSVVQLPQGTDADGLGIAALAPLLKEKLKMFGGLDEVIPDP